MTRSKMLKLVLIVVVCVMGTGVGGAEDLNVTLAGSFGGAIYTSAISGNYAYIGQGQNFVVFDIRNPASPEEVNKMPIEGIEGHVNDIELSRNYACVTDNKDGLFIVNISNPATPTLTGSYLTKGFYTAPIGLRGVTVLGNYVVRLITSLTSKSSTHRLHSKCKLGSTHRLHLLF